MEVISSSHDNVSKILEIESYYKVQDNNNGLLAFITTKLSFVL